MIRACLHPGCPNPATSRGRCKAHARQRNRETHRNRSVYNSKRWAMTRRRVLFEQSLCEIDGCHAIATDVHHKQDLADGGDPWARENLAALCHYHHSQITRATQG